MEWRVPRCWKYVDPLRHSGVAVEECPEARLTDRFEVLGQVARLDALVSATREVEFPSLHKVASTWKRGLDHTVLGPESVAAGVIKV